MKYILKIQFSDNNEKAGKLSLISENGEVIIKKSSVGIPSQQKGEISFISQGIKENYLKIDYLAKNYNYSKAFENLMAIGISKSLIIGNQIFIPNLTKLDSGKLSTVADAFVVSNDTFDKISHVLSKDLINLQCIQSKFLWFPEKINSKNSDLKIKDLIKEFKDTQKLADTLYKNTQVQHDKKSSWAIHKKSTTSHHFNVSNQDTKINDNLDSSNYEVSNEVEVLHHVDSLKAWANFFNQENDNINIQSVQQNISQVKGFENIERAELKYTPSGYSVDMFDNENKKLGALTYDGLSQSYQMISPNKEQTTHYSHTSLSENKNISLNSEECRETLKTETNQNIENDLLDSSLSSTIESNIVPEQSNLIADTTYSNNDFSISVDTNCDNNSYSPDF